MSNRSVVGLFINPNHQRRMMPAKYAGIMMEIKLSSSVPRCDWDSVLSCMHIVYYEDPEYGGSDMLEDGKIITSYGRTWLLQHDLLPCWWLTDRQLGQVIKYYGLDKIAWESE